MKQTLLDRAREIEVIAHSTDDADKKAIMLAATVALYQAHATLRGYASLHDCISDLLESGKLRSLKYVCPDKLRFLADKLEDLAFKIDEFIDSRDSDANKDHHP